MLTYELIVSTMKQNDDSLIKNMNINSNAIIINQADTLEYRETDLGDYKVKWYTLNDRGLGLSRDSGLVRATADIVQFADDDMLLSDTYMKDIVEEYEKHPEADVILFSNRCLNKDRMPYQVNEFKRVHRLEAVKFGGARITARREKLLYNQVLFSPIFGAGGKYNTGEDTTFLQDCIKAGLKVYKSPIIISTMEQNSSSWFDGYTEKYFFNKGALLERNFPVLSGVGSYVQAFKKYRTLPYSYLDIKNFYRKGIIEYRKKK